MPGNSAPPNPSYRCDTCQGGRRWSATRQAVWRRSAATASSTPSPERSFDDLTLLASHICGTPMALITLVDADRQWFKSRIGIADQRDGTRSLSFCAHAIKHRDLFIVPDATARRALPRQPVRHRRVRTSASMPARRWSRPTDTRSAPCACSIASRGRCSREQLDALTALCRQAEAQLELRRHLMELQAALDGARSRAGRAGEADRGAALRRIARRPPAERADAVLLDLPVHHDDSGRSARDPQGHRRRHPRPAGEGLAGGRRHGGRAGAAGGRRQRHPPRLRRRREQAAAVRGHLRRRRRDHDYRARPGHRASIRRRSPTRSTRPTC